MKSDKFVITVEKGGDKWAMESDQVLLMTNTQLSEHESNMEVVALGSLAPLHLTRMQEGLNEILNGMIHQQIEEILKRNVSEFAVWSEEERHEKIEDIKEKLRLPKSPETAPLLQ